MGAPDPSPDDATLARLAQGGSTDAFGILVGRYHARVFGFLLALTHHHQDAEDLTQETFVRAWVKFHRYQPELPILPWLFTLARRQSIRALRKSRPLPAGPLLPESAPGPDSAASKLWHAARSILPPASFSALWLHYREELPLKEVAAVLGKREGAVKVMLHRARKTLAEALRGTAPAPGKPPALPDSITAHET